MDQKNLDFINATTSDFHDDVAAINEEFVDGNKKLTIQIIDGLIEKLKHLKTNLRKDEV